MPRIINVPKRCYFEDIAKWCCHGKPVAAPAVAASAVIMPVVAAVVVASAAGHQYVQPDAIAAGHGTDGKN